MNINKPHHATVSDVLDIMKKLEGHGLDDYIVTCNMEYTLAHKGDEGVVNREKQTVDLGGYDD